ncbi:hypothetical protein TNCV_1202581 [Trichonephila clavipes]|nr:hypothetical protein TNCV_1202581 [Trichonephila clavipes]
MHLSAQWSHLLGWAQQALTLMVCCATEFEFDIAASSWWNITTAMWLWNQRVQKSLAERHARSRRLPTTNNLEVVRKVLQYHIATS